MVLRRRASHAEAPLKTLFFLICYHPSPRQPAGKVQSFGPEGWGYSEGGQIKTNFSLFSFVCVGVCAKYFWRRETISPVVFLWKSVGIPVFLLMQYKSGSLYFLHKLLNETAYLRSMKSPRVGITAFLVCATAWNRSPSEREREPVNRLPVWGKKLQGKGRELGGGGKRACRQTFAFAIPPSCNYLAEHLSVRSLSVNQFRSWLTPGKINGKWTVFCFVSKQSEIDREPNCRFCKRSLIFGKRINTVPVLGVSRNKTLLVQTVAKTALY